MITKDFAKRVVANHARGLVTMTKSGNIYYAELIDFDKFEPGKAMVVVRRVDREDSSYAPIVAGYQMGSGWHVMG